MSAAASRWLWTRWPGPSSERHERRLGDGSERFVRVAPEMIRVVDPAVDLLTASFSYTVDVLLSE